MNKAAKKAPVRVPAVLDGFRPLEFASTNRPVTFSGRTYLFVGDKEMGRVPRLVIAESLRTSDIVVLHCDGRWNVLGVQGGYKSAAEAERRAERMYPGISRAWRKANVTKRAARAAYDKQWEPWRCSFCSRIPPELDGSLILSQKTNARICHMCVEGIHETLKEQSS